MDQTPSCSVRQALERDRDRFAALWKTFLEEQSTLDARVVVAEDADERWHNDFAEWVSAKVHGLFVAETEQELIGFVSAHLSFPAPIYKQELEVYLDELYVVSDWRRRGVARMLFGQVRSWAEERHARRIRLGVLRANEGGLAFWRATGAEPFVETLVIDM
jgi:GNAT superfamily N-acetyltransferase